MMSDSLWGWLSSCSPFSWGAQLQYISPCLVCLPAPSLTGDRAALAAPGGHLHFFHFFHQENGIFPSWECWTHLLCPWAQTEQKAMGRKAASLGTSHTSFATSCKLLLCMVGTLLGAGGERSPCARAMATKVFGPVLVFPSPWCGLWWGYAGFLTFLTTLDVVPWRSLSMGRSGLLHRACLYLEGRRANKLCCYKAMPVNFSSL